MSLYDMVCRNCGYADEVYAPIHEGPPRACPDCGAGEGEGFSQDWQAKRVGGIAYGYENVKTLGQQAEYNAKKLGRERTDRMFEEELVSRVTPAEASPWANLPGAEVGRKKPAKRPWWRDGSVPGLPRKDRPLTAKQLKKLQTKEQVERYVNEGKL